MKFSRRRAAFFAIILLLGACTAAPSVVRPALEEEGEIYIYLDAFPQEADALKFRVEEISALGEDGSRYPLTMKIEDLSLSAVDRQRLLAWGVLPPGKYLGLSVKVKEAVLETGEAESIALALPEEPGTSEFPFEIERKKSLMLSFRFLYAESVGTDLSFTPVFSVESPALPVQSLLGYAVNYGSNTITIFNKREFRVTGVLATGRGPRGMALDPIGKRAYVSLSDEDAVDAIDTITGEFVGRINLRAGDFPTELALTPNGDSLLIVNTGSDSVSVADPFSLAEIERITVGDGPNSILLEPVTGQKAYVFNTLSNTISILDIPNRALSGTLSTETGPLRGQLNRDQDRLYVIHQDSPYLNVFDAASLQLLKRELVGLGVISIKVDTDTDFIYLGRRPDPAMYLLDPFSFVSMGMVRTGGSVAYMTIDGEENNLYLLIPEQNELLIMELVSRRIIARMDMGEEPAWVTLIGER